jgi:hypothetical protein
MRAFQFGDTLQIEVSDEFEKYNALYIKFANFSVQCRGEFERYFKTPFTSIDDLLDKGPKMYFDYLNKLASMAVKLFVAAGVMSMDENSFLKKYYGITNFDEHFEKIASVNERIAKAKEDMDRAAQLRKAARPKWVATGGYGMSGVLKNMAKASALNAGAGVLHGLGDLGVSSGNNAEISSQKKKLFLKGREILTECVHDSLYGLSMCVFFELEDLGALDVPDFDINEARALFRNAQNHLKDSGARLEAYINSILKYPYDPNVYIAIIKENPKHSVIALETADFFGLNHNPGIQKEREALLVEGVLFPSKPEAEAARKILSETEKMIKNIMTAPWDDIVAHEERLNEFVKGFRDKPYTVLDRARGNFTKAKDERHRRDRTFRGTLYDTLEERNLAEQAYEQRRLDQSADVENELEERLKDIDLTKSNKETFKFCCETRDSILQKYDFDTLTDGDLAQKLDGYIKKYKTRKNILIACAVLGIIAIIVGIANIGNISDFINDNTTSTAPNVAQSQNTGQNTTESSAPAPNYAGANTNSNGAVAQRNAEQSGLSMEEAIEILASAIYLVEGDWVNESLTYESTQEDVWVNSEECYGIQAYEDAGDHTATYGWFAVGKNSGAIYVMDMVEAEYKPYDDEATTMRVNPYEGKTWYVHNIITSNINVRDYPLTGNIIAKFTPNTVLEALYESEEMYDGYYWLCVTDGTTTGWIIQDYELIETFWE